MKMVLLKNSQENTCVGVSFLIKLQALSLQLYLKNTPVEVFSCEFCETCKNNSFCGAPLVAASLTFLAINYFCEKVPS